MSKNKIDLSGSAGGKGGCAIYINLGVDDESMLVATFRAAIKKDGLTNEQVEILRHNSDIVAHMIKLFMKDKGRLEDGGTIAETATFEVRENPVVFAEMLINKMKHSPMEWPEVRKYILQKISGVKFRELLDEEVVEIK